MLRVPDTVEDQAEVGMMRFGPGPPSVVLVLVQWEGTDPGSFHYALDADKKPLELNH